MEHADLIARIIGAAMRVHSKLGVGFLESVYQKALAHELRKSGLELECRRRVRVRYDDVIVGDFVCDMLVQEAVLVENKAIRMITAAHEAQLVNYLAATGIEVGLLLNFGAARLEFRRRTRTYRWSTRDTGPAKRECGQDRQKRQDGQDGQDGQDERMNNYLKLDGGMEW